MRFALALPILAAAGLCACTTTSDKNPDRVQTTSQAERESLTGAVGAPLRDLNVMRTKIPPVLLEALSDPYYRPPGTKLSCGDIITMLEPLNQALGADLDEPSKDEDDVLDKGRMIDRGKGAAYGMVAGAASGAIPFRGWVRKLSGAERHDRYVQAAITAGAVRRGYLKGLGEAKSCPPPATPSHVLTGSPVLDQSLKPRYPTRRPLPGAENPDGTQPSDPPR